jgi:hypothetical protein
MFAFKLLHCSTTFLSLTYVPPVRWLDQVYVICSWLSVNIFEPLIYVFFSIAFFLLFFHVPATLLCWFVAYVNLILTKKSVHIYIFLPLSYARFAFIAFSTLFFHVLVS